MKYRKLPVEIEAIQFDGANYTELYNFCGEQLVCTAGYDPMIKTLEGYMRVLKGDYIIKGVNGEFYPCKPNIFEKTYERLEDE